MGDGAWAMAIKVANILVCAALAVELVIFNIICDKYLADFESRAQIAKRTVHMGWLVFLVLCHLDLKFVMGEFETWKTLPGKMIVSGVVYFLICPSMLSDPVLIKVNNSDIDTSVVSSVFRIYLDFPKTYVSYIVVTTSALAFGIGQIIAGYHNAGAE
ncbi:hypothetical protein GGF40_003707 [Coemansia sp. RSA 1286]|nr:hypothetical protein GGF40_003707 [Coemansia sp. RSA 1286]